jgi:FtsP/CotA-like multicopper oxidase with cupredoxin domain
MAPFASIPLAIAATHPSRILRAERRVIEVHGRAADVFGLQNEHGGAGLSFAVDEPFNVRLDNRIGRPTLIHWHGLTPPWEQDGMPGMPAGPLESDESRDYEFPLQEAGTFWMHSHLGLQEQALLAAPLIVRDPDESAIDRQDVVVMLHDFSFRPAEELLLALNTEGHGMTGGAGTSATPDVHAGHMMDPDSGSTSGMMDEAGMMIHANDIEFDAYLANDRTLDDPEIVPVERAGRVRLRIVNAAAATNFYIDTGELVASLIAVDGRAIRAIGGSRFPLAISQRIDLEVTVPKSGGSFPILALREGDPARTGIVLATAGAATSRLSGLAEKTAGFLDLDFEHRMQAATPLAERRADRRLTADLLGGHGDYRWGVDLRDRSGSGSIKIVRGERIEIALRNRTGMSHPMHLHGHGFQIVAIGEHRFRGARRDTVLVPPASTVTIAFDADNPGRWMLHCHHLYHMAAGMISLIDYRDVA